MKNGHVSKLVNERVSETRAARLVGSTPTMTTMSCDLTVEEWMNAREILGRTVTAKLNGLSVEFCIWNSTINGPELDFKGYIKWDGCSNWDFEGHYPLHFCGQKEAKEFGEFLAALYDWAQALMPDSEVSD